MSTTGPVKWNDYDESRISISCSSDEIIGIRTSRDENVSTKAHVAIDRLPEFAAALYAAAGMPEPVILERPSGTAGRFEGVKIDRAGDSVVLWIGGNRVAYPPAGARVLAARLAVFADETENEPDPAEVEELAAVIRKEECDGGDDPREFDRDAARAALKWMRRRETS